MIAGAKSLVPRMRSFFARSRSMLSSRKQAGPLSPVLEETGLANMFHLPSFHRSQTHQDTEDNHTEPQHQSGRGAGASHGSAINKCVVKFKSLLGRNKEKDAE